MIGPYILFAFGFANKKTYLLLSSAFTVGFVSTE